MSRSPLFQLLLVLAAAILFVPSLLGQVRKERRERTEPTPIRKPDDPTTVKGTWIVGGTRHEITAGEFYELHQLLQKLEGTAQRTIPEDAVWEFLLSAAEAQSFGLNVTEGELDSLLNRDDPDLYEGVLARWEAEGISKEKGIDYVRKRQAINKLKNLLLNTDRITTQDAFDFFKKEHLLYKIGYLAFRAADHIEEVKQGDISDSAIKKYWSENRAVPQRFRSPSKVWAEFVFLDPNTFQKAKVGTEPRKLTREEALDFFHKNKQMLMAQIPPDKQHLLHFDENTPLEKVVSPFELLRDKIDQMLMLDQVLTTARKEADEKGADLAAIAAKYGLGYKKVEDCDRAFALTELRPFGFNIFTALFNAEVGSLSEGILQQGQIRYFFRLNKKKDSYLPSLDEVKDQVREMFITSKATELARKEAYGLMNAMNVKAAAELAEQEKRLTAEAEAAAADRIRELGLTRPQDKNREKMLARGRMRRELEQAKRDILPKYLDEAMAEKGLKLQETDYFEYQMARAADIQRAQAKTAEEFLQSNFYIRSLKPGQVAPAVIDDNISKCFYIAKLLDVKDPPFESMGPVDAMQARARIAQLAQNAFSRRFRLPELRDRLALVIKN